MDKNKVIYPKQFGFRKNHSTQDAFALLTGEILSCFSKQFKILTVFVDLKKAFDTVNHSIILRKLERIGVRDESLNWFKSYLSNRKQKVVYGDTQSNLKNLEMGVPQGSLLGVALFQLHINDMRNALRFSSSILYADDTTIYVIGKNLHAMKAKIEFK